MGATRALLPPQNHRVTARSQARFQLPAEAEGHALPLPDFQAHLRPQQMDRNGEERLDRKLGTRVPRGLHALWPSVRPWKPLSPPEHPPSGWEQKQATLHLAGQVARSREGPHTVTSAPGSLQAEPHAGHHVLGRFPLRDCETGGSDLRAASPCLKFLDVKGIVRKVFPSETPAAGILIIHTGKKNANFFICRSSVGDSDLPQPGCSLGTSVRKWGVTSNEWQ